ncbi:TPA: helix-turn-helix domain-containing protein [Salmonella enterica subsp. enterica]
MVTFGKRLRDERKRLGLNQADIAELCGVSTKTWGKYERGVTTPDAAILSLLGTQCGLDVFYVLFGSRSKGVSDITDDEIELIKTYRAAPLMVKAAALAALTAGSSASNAINVSGKGNRVAGRDYNEKNN